LSGEEFDEDEDLEHVEEGAAQVDEADTVTADQTNGDGPGAFDIDTDI